MQPPSRQDTYPSKLDDDTGQLGTEPPFDPWAHDHTSLVHVLWAARRAGLDLAKDSDEIASMIMKSRWLAAQRHDAATHDRTLTEKEG